MQLTYKPLFHLTLRDSIILAIGPFVLITGTDAGKRHNPPENIAHPDAGFLRRDLCADLWPHKTI